MAAAANLLGNSTPRAGFPRFLAFVKRLQKDFGLEMQPTLELVLCVEAF